MSFVMLKTELRQEQKLTPQLIQSMQVLQMNVQDLQDYLNRASEENPLLELETPLQSAYAELRRKASWLDAGPHGATFSHEDTAFPERGAEDHALSSLSAFLRDQLERRKLSKPLLALTVYLAELVDEDGYLQPEDFDSLQELHLPESLVRDAVAELQSLDPAGVGARDLSECLVLQLRRMGGKNQTALAIAAQFLPELGRRQFGAIARSLNVSLDAVQSAEKVISKLDPHPGRAFQSADPTPTYIQPDVFIVELDGRWQVVLNDYYLPRVSISSYYEKLLKESDEAETRTYLREKMKQAKWLLDSLERRGSTLRQCAEAILQTQRPFFTGESLELAPMQITTLAAELGVHASTVSRTARGKYLQCRQGTYPLRYFFNRAVGDEGLSRQAVKQKLLEFIRQEDPKHPLSDQKLVEQLNTLHAHVARRTVAKYRMELGIGSSTARRRR